MSSRVERSSKRFTQRRTPYSKGQEGNRSTKRLIGQDFGFLDLLKNGLKSLRDTITYKPPEDFLGEEDYDGQEDNRLGDRVETSISETKPGTDPLMQAIEKTDNISTEKFHEYVNFLKNKVPEGVKLTLSEESEETSREPIVAKPLPQRSLPSSGLTGTKPSTPTPASVIMSKKRNRVRRNASALPSKNWLETKTPVKRRRPTSPLYPTEIENGTPHKIYPPSYKRVKEEHPPSTTARKILDELKKFDKEASSKSASFMNLERTPRSVRPKLPIKPSSISQFSTSKERIPTRSLDRVHYPDIEKATEAPKEKLPLAIVESSKPSEKPFHRKPRDTREKDISSQPPFSIFGYESVTKPEIPSFGSETTLEPTKPSTNKNEFALAESNIEENDRTQFEEETVEEEKIENEENEEKEENKEKEDEEKSEEEPPEEDVEQEETITTQEQEEKISPQIPDKSVEESEGGAGSGSEGQEKGVKETSKETSSTLFSFTPSVTKSQPKLTFSAETPKFSFGEAQSDTPKFSFGNKESEAPKFSFGKSEPEPEPETEAPKFSFGKAEPASDFSLGKTEDAPKLLFGKAEETPKFSFGSADTGEKKTSFSFGESTTTSSPVETKQTEEPPSSTQATPTFSFGTESKKETADQELKKDDEEPKEQHEGRQPSFGGFAATGFTFQSSSSDEKPKKRKSDEETTQTSTPSKIPSWTTPFSLGEKKEETNKPEIPQIEDKSDFSKIERRELISKPTETLTFDNEKNEVSQPSTGFIFGSSSTSTISENTMDDSSEPMTSESTSSQSGADFLFGASSTSAPSTTSFGFTGSFGASTTFGNSSGSFGDLKQTFGSSTGFATSSTFGNSSSTPFDVTPKSSGFGSTSGFQFAQPSGEMKIESVPTDFVFGQPDKTSQPTPNFGATNQTPFGQNSQANPPFGMNNSNPFPFTQSAPAFGNNQAPPANVTQSFPPNQQMFANPPQQSPFGNQQQQPQPQFGNGIPQAFGNPGFPQPPNLGGGNTEGVGFTIGRGDNSRRRLRGQRKRRAT